MRIRTVSSLFVVGAVGLFVWHSQLFTVARPGAHPLPIVLIPEAAREPVEVDVLLSAVPVGMQRVRSGGAPLLVHFWAPWERHSLAQAIGLDSLRRSLPPGELHVAVVCFDPYPSVARYLGRMRLALPVVLDQRRALARGLPCPSMPYTYLLDAHGRVAAEQAGEVDWLGLETRAAIDSLLAEPAAPRAAPPLPAPNPTRAT